MKFGYMAGFRADLLSEVEFAKKYFDFVEITIQPELLKTIDDVLYDIKNALNKFEVLGHIHWEISEFDDIIENIEILKNLGAKKITLHAFEDLNIEENVKIFNKIDAVLQKNGTQLLIENTSNTPFNSADNILKLVEKIPNANITLDIGHANRILELDKFINIFRAKIRHIHLHDNVDDLDHIFYKQQNKLEEIFSKIKSFGYDGTILLETFSIMQNGKNVSQKFSEIKLLHIEQLKKIKLE